MVGYSGKVDHLLMPGPGGPELEHSFSSQHCTGEDPFQAQHNMYIICI